MQRLWHYLFHFFETRLSIHAGLRAMTAWSLLNWNLRCLFTDKPLSAYGHSYPRFVKS